jgi:CRP-like cAMP-binding protein
MDAAFRTTGQFLAAVSPFSTLSAAELAALAPQTTVLEVPRAAVICHQGDPCAALHVIVHGQVALVLQGTDGTERVVELLGPGATFGETSLYLGKPYLMGARALRATRLMRLGRNAVLQQIRRSPSFSEGVIALLSSRLHSRTLELQSQITLSGMQRVVAFLLNDCCVTRARSGVAVLLPARKGTIASRLNLTQSHFSRILRALAAPSLIEVNGRTAACRTSGPRCRSGRRRRGSPP